MENRPERPASVRRKKERSAVNTYRRMLTLLFAVFVAVVSYVVIVAINSGLGLPVSGEGQYLDQEQALLQSTSSVLGDESAQSESSSAPESAQQTQQTEPTESTQPTEPTEPTEPSLAPQALAQSYLDSMTMEEKIWQMMIVSSDRLTAVDQTQYPVGAVFYAAENLTDAQLLADDMFAVQAMADTPVMFGVMHEGGSVSPLTDLGVADEISSMRTYGKAGDADALYDVSLNMGKQLSQLGFHFNLAPVADTYTNLNDWRPSEVHDMENRTFGSIAEVNSGLLQNMVSQCVRGMNDGGIIACVKHFPNFGSTAPTANGDTSWRTYQTFCDYDLKPFVAGIDAGAQMILVSNMNAPYLTDGFEIPCCRARAVVTELLRNELGFDGVIITDDQSSQTDTANIVATVQAGCDMVYLPYDAPAAVAAILDAVNSGTISEDQINESVYRILLLKCQNGIITE